MKETIKLPVFFFMLNAAFASWQVLFNVYLNGIGFSSLQIGALNAVFISTSALVVPFWGVMADKFGTNRVMLVLTLVCGVMVFVIGETLAFHWMLTFIFIISVFHQPGGAVVDGMALGFVRKNPGYAYGSFRMWGSIGWGLMSLLIGYIARGDTSRIFYVAAIMFLLISLFNLFTLPKKPIRGGNTVNLKSLGVFFRNKTLFTFFLLILLYGLAMSPLHQFINLYYKDLGAENSFIGWVFFVQAIFEAPTFLLAVRIAKKQSPQRLIVFSMIVSTLRMFLYGFIQTPELAISLSLFHGITIAFFLVGVVDYVQKRTPFHLRTTGQALIWAFHFGVGVTLGNLSLGYLRDHGGMHRAMHIHSLFSAVIILAIIIFFLRTAGKREDVYN